MTAAEMLSRVSIGAVWYLCGGGEIRRSRARAFWRHGDGWTVSLNDSLGTWYDFRDGIGGGKLDLICHVNGGTRADALRWLADRVGTVLDAEWSARFDPAYRTALEEAAVVRRNVRYFATAARIMAEHALSKISEVSVDRFELNELLVRLQKTPEAEYLDWSITDPKMAEALVETGRKHERRIQTLIAHCIKGMSDVT